MTETSGYGQPPQGPAWFSLTGLIQGLQAVAQALYRVNQTLGNSYIGLSDNNTFAGVNSFGQAPVLPTYTVSSLPAGIQGMRAQVSDATVTTFATKVVGGGSNYVPVLFNGGAWIIG
jgi:hypothetical protein